jgi:hypothetical protein
MWRICEGRVVAVTVGLLVDGRGVPVGKGGRPMMSATHDRLCCVLTLAWFVVKAATASSSPASRRIFSYCVFKRV